MVECKTRYSIKIIVEVDGTQYVSYRNYPDSGCNHVDNIPGTANYMGQKLLKKILQPKSGLVPVKLLNVYNPIQ